MSNIDRLDAFLKKKEPNFQEAVTFTLSQILQADQWPVQRTAWERLINPRHRWTVNNTPVDACPLLLGCLQLVHQQEDTEQKSKIVSEWRNNVIAQQEKFFKRRQEQLTQRETLASPSEYHTVQDILTCAAAAIAGKSMDAELSQKHHLRTAQIRDLKHWLASPLQPLASSRKQRITIPFVEAEQGACATLEVECHEGTGEFYADPVAMAFVRWDESFQKAFDNACAYIRQLGQWQHGLDVCWRVIAEPPLIALNGGSAGGAFFVNLWHLLTDTPNDVSVTISAGIDENGRLAPVQHIHNKIHALLKNPIITGIVVAQDQHGIQEEWLNRLQIWRARYAGDPQRHGRISRQ